MRSTRDQARGPAPVLGWVVRALLLAAGTIAGTAVAWTLGCAVASAATPADDGAHGADVLGALNGSLEKLVDPDALRAAHQTTEEIPDATALRDTASGVYQADLDVALSRDVLTGDDKDRPAATNQSRPSQSSGSSAKHPVRTATHKVDDHQSVTDRSSFVDLPSTERPTKPSRGLGRPLADPVSTPHSPSGVTGMSTAIAGGMAGGQGPASLAAITAGLHDCLGALRAPSGALDSCPGAQRTGAQPGVTPD